MTAPEKPYVPPTPEPVDAAALAQQYDDLVAEGYRDIPDWNGIRPGDRVHHRNQRYPEASRLGTATVQVVMEKSPSMWAKKYGERDIELLVLRDEPLLPGMTRISMWANYHVGRIRS